MQRAPREGLEATSPRSSRAGSVCSDRPSLSGPLSDVLATTLHPPPAYVAVSAASETVTNHHHEQFRENFDMSSPSTPEPDETSLFSENALCLVNAFIDYLLFNFLFKAKGPSLMVIRPAIVAVLKTRLARDAMAIADEELEDLGGVEDEEEELRDLDNDEMEWNLEVAFKRTRLRVMVYSRLGDMEDEEEERYLELEDAFHIDGEVVQDIGLVTGAAGIYLASVTEFVAKEILKVAGQAAYTRIKAKQRRNIEAQTQAEDPDSPHLDRVVVEEADVEKVALNPTMSRLWREWRKHVRSSTTSPSSAPSRASGSRSMFGRPGSRATTDGVALSLTDSRFDTSRRPSLMDVPECDPSETDIAANIPLPFSGNDVAEIEVPGLAQQFDDEDSQDATPILRPQRRRSDLSLAGLAAPPSLQRLRSRSVPTLERVSHFNLRNVLKEQEPTRIEGEVRTQTEEPEAVTGPHSTVHSADGTLQKPEDGENKGIAAGIVTGATSLVATAVASVLGTSNTKEEPLAASRERDLVDSRHTSVPGTFVDAQEEWDAPKTPIPDGLAPVDDDIDSASLVLPAECHDDSQILKLKRVSMSTPPTPPEVVRTTSRQSTASTTSSGSSHKHLMPAPLAVDRSVGQSTEEHDNGDPEAIGIARTSDVPIHAPQAISRSSTPDDPNRAYSPNGFPGQKALEEDRSPRRFSVSPSISRNAHSPAIMAETSYIIDQSSSPRPPSSLLKETLPPVRESTEAVPARAQKDVARSSPPREKQSTTSVVVGQPVILNGLSHHPPPSVPEPPVRPSKESSRSTKSINKGKLPNLQTSLGDQRPPSSSRSSRGTGSNRGSQSSVVMGRTSEQSARDFENLVRGEETVKLTLTPQTMRQLDGSSSSDNQNRTSISPKDLKLDDLQHPISSASSKHSPPRAGPRISSVAPVPVKKPGFVTGSRQYYVRYESNKSGSSRRSGLEPRDARVKHESTRDFADYIRSTAPERPLNDPVPFSTSLRSSRAGKSDKQPPSSSTSSSLKSPVSGNRSKTSPRRLEPREAVIAAGGSSDLADFIRQGPLEEGQHRIPRTIAPFRTTMDSDELNGLVSGRSVTSTPQTSVNSRTSLLANNNQPTFSNKSTLVQYSSLAAPDPHPVRKRRRVKDPYAIDSDDEEMDTLTALPRREEESLVDFLRNSEPSPGSNVPRPLTGVSRPQSNGSGGHASAQNGIGTSTSNGNTGALGPRPVQISPNVTSAPAPPAFRSKMTTRSAGGREARIEASRQDTRDLADFLKQGPGPGHDAAPAPLVAGSRPSEKKKKAAGGGAKFWKKKTYLDMP